MNNYRLGPPPRWWNPKLSPRIVRWTAALRSRMSRRMHRLSNVHVHNEQIVRDAMSEGHGVMITPNHSSHADPHAIYDAADLVRTPIFIMATWHVFDVRKKFGQWLLQKHGCFSVDRDGADLKAFKEAIRILQHEPFPLVIFPEGEIYHCNDRITPFLEGPATIASTAARKGDRPVVIIPCAMKYQYLEDPTPHLLDVMSDLEQQILWRPRPQDDFQTRIYHFSEALLTLKEIEYLGEQGHGELPARVEALACAILARHEQTREMDCSGKTIPERVKEIRRRCVMELCNEENPIPDDLRLPVYEQLDDAFMVGQLFSYPGNYIREAPSIERIAETIDKFEEDVLKRPTATIRGQREVHIYFGEPMQVSGDRKNRTPPAEMTRQMEEAVQNLLDQHNA
ncbi:MAG: lysophospholipid acyltransferase family protein [Pirellulaceae bacterium]